MKHYGFRIKIWIYIALQALIKSSTPKTNISTLKRYQLPYFRVQKIFSKRRQHRELLQQQTLRTEGQKMQTDLLSHVLPVKDGAADGAFEAPDVPLLVQGDECLALHQLLFAPGTFCKEKETWKT